MTATRPQPPGPHEAALLLPWYVGGTLGDGERLFVEAHLRECAECRSELESVEDVRQRTRAMFGSGLAPSARLHAEVMARVRESPPTAPTPLQSFAEALQWLLRPKWAPALAALLIVVQAGALGWFVLQGSPQPEVRTRSVEAAAARIRVVFNPNATEAEIRAALTALGGRIVDGPSADGVYVIELPAVEPTILSQRLRELRQRPGLVERIENAAP
jgi:anti-sigma factor RsiW